ncbi:hypothetical protein Taro_010146 [Colocasia esculenta]|uniref:Uncharacterized protein n=1 Tax=Colocasia esculenta TaxID=4460 RepID=A0A843TY45_COLES|nr:hypothetical protein [Colocasia esculenta]
MKKWSTSVDTRPGQVDTRDRSQRNKSTNFYISLGQCVDTPYGQVDTLRKLCDLRFLLDMWHPRELMDRPWIVCPRTPRVPLDYLGYKYPPIGHPSDQNLFRASQKPVFAARRVHLHVPTLLAFEYIKSTRLLPLGRLRSRKRETHSLHPLKKKATILLSRSRRRQVTRCVSFIRKRPQPCRVHRDQVVLLGDARSLGHIFLVSD